MAASHYYDLVQKFYIAYFGRPADPKGLEAWAGALDDGWRTIDQLVEAFGASTESNNLYASTSDEQMITILYQQLFNRDPESQEIIDAWVLQLNNNPDVSHFSIAMELLKGAQGSDAQVIQNRLDAAKAFTEAFDEIDDSVEYNSSEVRSWLATVGNDAASKTNALTTLPYLMSRLEQSSDSLGIVDYNQELAQLISQDTEVKGFLRIDDVTVSEEDGQALLTVSRQGDSTESLDLDFVTEDASAIAGQDFIATSGTVSFASGETEQQISIPIINGSGDALESFYVRITETEGWLLLDDLAVITISDPESGLNISQLISSNSYTFDLENNHFAHLIAIDDINGDGADEVLSTFRTANSPVQVVYGETTHQTDFNNQIKTPDVFEHLYFQEPDNTLRLTYSMDSAGDVNGDGFDDFYVTSRGTEEANHTYLVYGAPERFGPEFYFNEVSESQGSLIILRSSESFGTLNPNAVGDLNGDGYDDLLVGAIESANPLDSAYVIFGQEQSLGDMINLAEQNDSIGGRLISSNSSLSFYDGGIHALGDINGDGYDDVVLHTPFEGDHGTSYVVFGHANSWSEEFDLANLDGINGFTLTASNAGGNQMHFPSGIGDINGDGFDDLLAYLYTLDDGTGPADNRAYIIYGQADGWNSNLDTSDLSSVQHTLIKEPNSNAIPVGRAASAGDVNGDGYADFIVDEYLIYGHSNLASESTLNLNTEPEAGMILIQTGDDIAFSGMGDLNGDGFNDLLFTSNLSGDLKGHVIHGSPNLDYTPVVNISDMSVNENAGEVSLTLTRVGSSDSVTTVEYHSRDISAASGFDYGSVDSSITFEVGESVKNIVIPIYNDNPSENLETFSVELTAVENGVIGRAEATVSIKNDNGSYISVVDLIVEESDGYAAVVIERTGNTDLQSSVEYFTSDGSATWQQRDYSPLSGTAIFTAGQSTVEIQIPLFEDYDTDSESFFFSLENEANALIMDNQAEITIIGDSSSSQDDLV